MTDRADFELIIYDLFINKLSQYSNVKIHHEFNNKPKTISFTYLDYEQLLQLTVSDGSFMCYVFNDVYDIDLADSESIDLIIRKILCVVYKKFHRSLTRRTNNFKYVYIGDGYNREIVTPINDYTTNGHQSFIWPNGDRHSVPAHTVVVYDKEINILDDIL